LNCPDDVSARGCSGSSMVYSECTSSCPRTCSNVYSVAASTCDSQRCYPGCQCPPHTFLSSAANHNDDGGWYNSEEMAWAAFFLVCVPVERCACRYQGRRYPPGSVVEVNCNTWYVDYSISYSNSTTSDSVVAYLDQSRPTRKEASSTSVATLGITAKKS